MTEPPKVITAAAALLLEPDFEDTLRKGGVFLRILQIATNRERAGQIA